ncbi:HD domain-containing protein, partial [Desulfallas thermosapovorans]
MVNQKIIQVADSLHGSIQISYLEKQIISTQAFNRLHNILQNSTVYLTYPSNQTKRFVHSLGTMHLGGLIFYNSLLNADNEVRDMFLDSINDEIEKLGNDNDFNRTLRLSLGDSFVDLMQDYRNIRIIYDREPIYQLNTPKVINDKHLFSYILIYQAIRLAALLHDVGHPPFSHISENALKEIWKDVKDMPDVDLNERRTYFKNSLKKFFENNAHLHEEIGYRIAERLTESVICNGPEQRDEAQVQLFYWLVSKFVTYIFTEESSLFEDIHRIIDGSIDCDRLDYVTRDLENSGFNYGRIEYDRLIRSMRLIIMNGHFLFCPDIRTLSTVEDFFNRRWLLYKYVIYHHRVIKTDYLLEKAIVGLARSYLGNPEKENEYNGGVLP